MKITYIHHSGFLVETRRGYYLFDYERGSLPPMDPGKPIFILASHSHADHYTPEVFSLVREAGMTNIRGILSEDIPAPEEENILSVAPGNTYPLAPGITVTAFRSTDLGVAFLLEEDGHLIYHAGDLNDWVWDEETEDYNREMTAAYRREIGLLKEALRGRTIDLAFLVLDPRQEGDYDRGICHFLEHIPAREVYPMHYWDDPSIMDTFLKEHPEYASQLRRTE